MKLIEKRKEGAPSIVSLYWLKTWRLCPRPGFCQCSRAGQCFSIVPRSCAGLASADGRQGARYPPGEDQLWVKLLILVRLHCFPNIQTTARVAESRHQVTPKPRAAAPSPLYDSLWPLRNSDRRTTRGSLGFGWVSKGPLQSSLFKPFPLTDKDLVSPTSQIRRSCPWRHQLNWQSLFLGWGPPGRAGTLCDAKNTAADVCRAQKTFRKWRLLLAPESRNPVCIRWRKSRLLLATEIRFTAPCLLV
jgi:hypothetical protein